MKLYRQNKIANRSLRGRCFVGSPWAKCTRATLTATTATAGVDGQGGGTLSDIINLPGACDGRSYSLDLPGQLETDGDSGGGPDVGNHDTDKLELPRTGTISVFISGENDCGYTIGPHRCIAGALAGTIRSPTTELAIRREPSR